MRLFNPEIIIIILLLLLDNVAAHGDFVGGHAENHRLRQMAAPKEDELPELPQALCSAFPDLPSGPIDQFDRQSTDFLHSLLLGKAFVPPRNDQSQSNIDETTGDEFPQTFNTIINNHPNMTDEGDYEREKGKAKVTEMLCPDEFNQKYVNYLRGTMAYSNRRELMSPYDNKGAEQSLQYSNQANIQRPMMMMTYSNQLRATAYNNQQLVEQQMHYRKNQQRPSLIPYSNQGIKQRMPYNNCQGHFGRNYTQGTFAPPPSMTNIVTSGKQLDGGIGLQRSSPAGRAATLPDGTQFAGQQQNHSLSGALPPTSATDQTDQTHNQLMISRRTRDTLQMLDLAVGISLLPMTATGTLHGVAHVRRASQQFFAELAASMVCRLQQLPPHLSIQIGQTIGQMYSQLVTGKKHWVPILERIHGQIYVRQVEMLQKMEREENPRLELELRIWNLRFYADFYLTLHSTFGTELDGTAMGEGCWQMGKMWQNIKMFLEECYRQCFQKINEQNIAYEAGQLAATSSRLKPPLDSKDKQRHNEFSRQQQPINENEGHLLERFGVEQQHHKFHNVGKSPQFHESPAHREVTFSGLYASNGQKHLPELPPGLPAELPLASANAQLPPGDNNEDNNNGIDNNNGASQFKEAAHEANIETSQSANATKLPNMLPISPLNRVVEQQAVPVEEINHHQQLHALPTADCDQRTRPSAEDEEQHLERSGAKRPRNDHQQEPSSSEGVFSGQQQHQLMPSAEDHREENSRESSLEENHGSPQRERNVLSWAGDDQRRELAPTPEGKEVAVTETEEMQPEEMTHTQINEETMLEPQSPKRAKMTKSDVARRELPTRNRRLPMRLADPIYHKDEWQ